MKKLIGIDGEICWIKTATNIGSLLVAEMMALFPAHD